MKLLTLLLFSSVALAEVKYRIGDIVRFKYTGYNLPYKKCSNIGRIEDKAIEGEVYFLIAINCVDKTGTLWVKQKDITGIVVTKVGK